MLAVCAWISAIDIAQTVASVLWFSCCALGPREEAEPPSSGIAEFHRAAQVILLVQTVDWAAGSDEKEWVWK